ncbi:flagellar basal-body MS-ring/collar protein FliF [Holophaga foetida]|uniref:flagellar basal-body MS-ring/collar protein FliF n=1 Tax=Holophaga foetida TaxID=35839 RepID=UPI00024742E4|nr:flagellar basal-body MS-ring/collar protein FliF [Holophaga foetida]
MAGENNLTSQLQRTLQNMSSTQKVVVGVIVLTFVIVLAGFGIWASQDKMEVLASNLPPGDASTIVENLRKQNIPYDLSSDQRTVYVPEKRVGELKLRFAGEGLLNGDKVGFEKLESPSLTTTDFTQKVVHRRAMEADLAKTIRSLQQVQDAVVHITPGSDSPFVTDKEEAKASVLLKLKGGRLLPEENTQAIVNLVAGSVEGLKADSVVVIDQYSRILSRTGRDPMVGASDSQKKVAREEEDHLVRRVTELLEPVVGLGKVRATAHLDLDFDKVKINEERFNPQEQVERSVNQKEEKITKGEGGAGVPGTASNVAPATGGGGRSGVLESSEKKETTTNYEISKTLRSVEQAPGTIKRVSLAVIVDNATTWEKPAKGDPKEKVTPRTAEELKKIRDQVAAAVGIKEDRGDQLTVENIPFASMENPKEEAEARKQYWLDQAKALVPYLVPTILGLAVFFLIVLPMLKKLSSAINRPSPLRVHAGEGDEEGGPVSASRRVTHTKSKEELAAEIEAELNAEGASSAPEAQRRQLIKKRIQETAVGDAETIASLVRSWMLEDTGR